MIAILINNLLILKHSITKVLSKIKIYKITDPERFLAINLEKQFSNRQAITESNKNEILLKNNHLNYKKNKIPLLHLQKKSTIRRFNLDVKCHLITQQKIPVELLRKNN